MRVVYIPIPIGTSDSAAVNVIFGAIATETANADEQNFTEEGLDFRVFESEVQSEQGFTPIEHTVVASQALTAVFATMDPGGVKLFRTGPITLGVNETLRVRFRGELLSNAAAYGLPGDTDCQIRFRRSVAAAPTVITSSLRRYRTLVGSPKETRMSMVAKIDGPLGLDWVEVEISDQSGNNNTVQIGRATLTGTIFKRVI